MKKGYLFKESPFADVEMYVNNLPQAAGVRVRIDHVAQGGPRWA